MKYRTFGCTGFRASLLGLGTWPLASSWWGPYDAKNARRAFRTALDLGVNFVDTAAAYDDGAVESLVSDYLRAERLHTSVLVATKVEPRTRGIHPQLVHGADAYPRHYLRLRIE